MPTHGKIENLAVPDSLYNLSSSGVLTRSSGTADFLDLEVKIYPRDSINIGGTEYIINEIVSSTELTVFGSDIQAVNNVIVYIQQKPKYMDIADRITTYGLDSDVEMQIEENRGGQHAGWVKYTHGAGGVVGINITAGGSGYTEAPEVYFSSGTAEATAVIDDGSVVAVNVTSSGMYSRVAPTVTIADPNEEGETATASVVMGGRFGRVFRETMVAMGVPQEIMGNASSNGDVIGFIDEEESPYPDGYDYYVDQFLGDDEADGSISAPWQTLSRVHEFARRDLTLSNSRSLTLSAAAVGERTATLSGGTWDAAHVSKTLSLPGETGQAPGAGTILAVDGLVATVEITAEAPKTSFSNNNYEWGIVEQPDGATTRVWVAAATWGGPARPDSSSFDNNTLSARWAPATPTRLELYFEAGSVMDDERDDNQRSCFYSAGGEHLTLAIYGDESEPLQILNYGTVADGEGTGQPFGASFSSRIEGYNFHISVCGDGISLHNDSTGHFENGYIEKHQKIAIANVQDSTATFENITIVARSGFPGVDCTAASHFTNCRILVDPGDALTPVPIAVQKLGGGSWIGGQLGTPTHPVIIANTTAAPDTYTDAYVHHYNGAAALAMFTRCYGRYTGRLNPNIAVGQAFRNCVFVGHALNQTTGGRTFHWAQTDLGGDAQRSTLDCVISGYAAAAVGGGFNSTYAGYWIASNSELRFCCFHGNASDINTSLVDANTADGGTKIANNLTVDPELADPAAIAAGSVDQADYCVTNQLLIGGGHDDGNIGFTTGDLN